jgi:hypothetical protein
MMQVIDQWYCLSAFRLEAASYHVGRPLCVSGITHFIQQVESEMLYSNWHDMHCAEHCNRFLCLLNLRNSFCFVSAPLSIVRACCTRAAAAVSLEAALSLIDL